MTGVDRLALALGAIEAHGQAIRDGTADIAEAISLLATEIGRIRAALADALEILETKL